MLPEQFLIPLLRRILYPRQKQLLVYMKTVYQLLLIHLSQRHITVDKPVKILPPDNSQFRRLNAFETEQARNALVQTVERGYKIPLKKELESNVLPLVIEKQPQAAFADKIEPFSNFPLLQKNRLRGDRQSLRT